ncbi:MAG: threonine--tRNA ligase [Candidatus Nealsonbacteria bacterium]
MKEENLRHSLSHILAHAVKELYPSVKFGMGPAIENGFYYDFEFKNNISIQDLPKIEKKMKELIKKNLAFNKKDITKLEAKKLFKDQPYKLNLIKDILDETVTIYESGNFVDLCKGPHLNSTKEINSESFKLEKTAGAYWKGTEKNQMLTRIYGLAFTTKKELEDYIKLQEEAEKRDHRLLGQKLELFMFDEEVGMGLPLWLPKGALLKTIIENYLKKELTDQGYDFVATPHIGRINLWKTSGHWENYRENIYSPIEIDEEKFLLKPMNCPFHVKIFQSKIRSYKDLPIKIAEFGTVYRYERSGTLHGLTRVRGFTQDDAHIWCAPDQLSEELEKLLRQGLSILKTFGFKKYTIYVSTRPDKYAGEIKNWDKATKILKNVLTKNKLEYEVDQGGGVFYGPKIDIKIKDSLNREWQCTTIQVDFNLTKRFDVNYIDKSGKKEKCYMIHRALLGSFERFIGVLIEHFAGDFPLWLSPVQYWILPISDKHEKYAKEVLETVIKSGQRAELKNENETLGKKIRNGEMQKIPYLLIVGDKEIKTKTVSVREREKGDLGAMKIKKLLDKTKELIEKNK